MFGLPYLLSHRVRASFALGLIRSALLLCVLFAPYSYCRAQTVNFEDGFEDGDFSDNPAWSGDIESFSVVEGNPNFQLRLQGDSNSGGIAFLSTPSTNTIGYWECFINLDGFSPSDGNRTDIFLMSDISDLNGPVNGYALRAGENGSNDVFRIVRYENGSEVSTVLSGIINISSGGTFRVKVIRQSGGIWSLETAPGYDGQLAREGSSQTDNTYTSTAYFGLRATYTATRFDRFYFDFKIDLPPFTVETVFPNGNTVDVTFNRPYDQATVQSSDFFIDNGIGAPASLSFPTQTMVRLFYDNNLPSNRYTLSVSNLADVNGETITPNTELNFIVYGEINSREIVINEFMYDPPIGLPEYVELRNISTKYVNLSNWRLGDQNGIGTISTNTLTFEPGGFLVLSPDTSALFQQFGHRKYVEQSSTNFPSLNNSGDAIRIFDGANMLIDSLYYFPEWGGEDLALERRSATAPSTKKANWGDSPHGIGTPGLPNLIEPDLIPPVFSALQIIDPSTLLLLFNEELDPESTTPADNYTISPNPGIELISAANDTVLLQLSGNLQSGQSYSIFVSNLEDIFGNTMNTESKEFEFVDFSTAMVRDIVLNEILYSRADGGGPEFVELYNTSDKNFDLSGWTIGDAVGTATLPLGTELLAGDYLVLTDNANFAQSLDNGIAVSNFPSLNDAGDTVFLRSPDDSTIDTLAYASAWGGNREGQSLERKDPLAASNDPANWSSSSAPNGNTGGGQNSVFQPDENSPYPIFAKELTDNKVEVQFNEFINITARLTFKLNGANLSLSHFDSDDAGKMVLEIPPGKLKRQSAILSIQNLSDIKGNITESADIPVAMALLPSDVVINEIMFNPLSDAEDNLSDQSEYIELRNTRNYAISLEGISLNDAPDENGEVRTLNPVTTEAKWIPPHGIALIYADEEPDFEQSRLADFFHLSGTGTPAPLRIDRGTLSLASTGDAIYLTDSTGSTIDSVFYNESWHNPNFIDTRGIALERIRPAGLSNDAGNWGSSTTSQGGTPNTENSIYQAAENLPEQTGISFSPNPFSPDDDGTDDNLLINYKLDEPDYLLKVRIYDRFGRLIRKLADNIPAGFEGSLIWNGRKDNGSSNRIGIYIVVFEAFNSTRGRNLAFKKTVVLARRLQ